MDDQLIEKISDDTFDPLTLSHEELAGGLCRLTSSCLATPLLCGSSLRNVAVQPLMDAIVTYLPSPFQRPLSMSVGKLNSACVSTLYGSMVLVVWVYCQTSSEVLFTGFLPEVGQSPCSLVSCRRLVRVHVHWVLAGGWSESMFTGFLPEVGQSPCSLGSCLRLVRVHVHWVLAGGWSESMFTGFLPEVGQSPCSLGSCRKLVRVHVHWVLA